MNRANTLFLSSVVLIFHVLAQVLAYGQQPPLQITSPVSGAVIQEGQPFTVTVSASSSVQVFDVVAEYPFPNLQPTSTSNQFSVSLLTVIPPGTYHLTAFGITSSGDVQSAPVAIDVETQYDPVSVNGQPTVLTPQVGNQLPIRAIGTYYDGSTLDVTNSSRTLYSSYNTQVATVSSTGMVTAVGPGQTFILLQTGETFYNYAYSVVLVQVPQPAPTAAAPVITTVAPTSGIPGTTQVTITGSEFGATQGNGFVQLGTLNASSISSWSNTQIVATVPSGSLPGVAAVNQNSQFSNSIPFTMSVPTISSISPISLVVGGQVTLTGSGFGATQNGGTVALQNVNASPIVSWSDTQIVAGVPTGATQGVAYVYANGVYSNHAQFTMTPPTLTSISPTSLVVGGQVTLTGSGFGSTQNGGVVQLQNVNASPIVSWSDTQIVAGVPTGATPGLASVVANGVYSNDVHFTMTPATLTSISPTSLVVGGQVTLTGSGFGATQNGGVVQLQNVNASPIVSWSDTQIVAGVPTGATPGLASVVANGVYSNDVHFTMTPPTLTSISPTSLVVGGQVTLTGSGFGAAQNSGFVQLQDANVTSIVSWSDTQIVAVVPVGVTPGSAFVFQNGVYSNDVQFTTQ